jgi:hypothetical protein
VAIDSGAGDTGLFGDTHCGKRTGSLFYQQVDGGIENDLADPDGPRVRSRSI